MTSMRLRVGMVIAWVLLAFSLVWGADESGLTRVEEQIPWRYIAILLIAVSGWFLSRTLDRINKLLDEYGHDLTRIKEHLGLKD